MDESNRYSAFLQKLNATPIQAERDWLTLEFSLDSLPESVQKLVWGAAVPHWFDREFLTALMGNAPSNDDYACLLDLSYVEVYQGQGHAIHEHSRKLLLEKLWQYEKDRYRKLSTRAAAHCAKHDQRETAWRVEWIYHRLTLLPQLNHDSANFAPNWLRNPLIF